MYVCLLLILYFHENKYEIRFWSRLTYVHLPTQFTDVHGIKYTHYTIIQVDLLKINPVRFREKIVFFICLKLLTEYISSFSKFFPTFSLFKAFFILDSKWSDECAIIFTMMCVFFKIFFCVCHHLLGQ